MSDYDRRSSERIAKQIPVFLHRDMVKTINLSEGGARLVVKSIEPLKEKMPLLIQTGEDGFAGLLCEPRWVKQIGKCLFIIGVSFPEGQDDLSLLRQLIRDRTD